MRTPREVPPRPVIAALWILAGSAIAACASALLRTEPEGPDAQLWLGLALQAVFACAALAGAAWAGSSLLPNGLGLGPSRLRGRETLALVAGFVCLSQALSVLLAGLALRESGALGEIERVVTESHARAPSLALALLALGVAPGVAEELLFRGLVQQGARAALGAGRAIVLSALLFGAVHLDPVHGPAAAILGLYLGSAMELSRSLRVPMLCHGVNNTLGVLFPQLGVPLVAWGVPLAALALLTAAALGLWLPLRRLRAQRRAAGS